MRLKDSRNKACILSSTVLSYYADKKDLVLNC